jgi:AcrR family transcriptional regulator
VSRDPEATSTLPSGGGVRTLRRDAAENRERLLDAAGRVFAEHGLEAGVDEVARVAGVGMGTLYRRFPTKDALIAELVRQLLSDVVSLAREALTAPDGTGLEQFLYATGEAQASHRGCLARLWSDETTIALKNECRDLIGELFRDAQAHGQVRSDAAQSDIDLLFWSLPGVIEATRALDVPAWRRHVALVVAGLRPSEQPLGEPALTAAEVALLRRRGVERPV